MKEYEEKRKIFRFILSFVTEYNDKAGFTINTCRKELEKAINKHEIRLFSEKESAAVKRKILWTSLDEYEPGKPMPEWIKEKFPY